MIRLRAGDLAGARADLDGAAAGHAARSAMVLAFTDAELALAVGRPADAARLLGYAAAVRGAPDLGNPDVSRAEATARAALDGEYEGLHVPAGQLSPDVAVTEVTALAEDLTGAQFG